MDALARAHAIPAAVSLATLLVAGCAAAGHTTAGHASGSHPAGTPGAQHSSPASHNPASHSPAAGPCRSQYAAWLKGGGLRDLLAVGKEHAAGSVMAQGVHLPARFGTAHAVAAGLTRAAQASLGDLPPPCSRMDSAYAASLHDYIAAATALAHGDNRAAGQEFKVADAANNQAVADGRAVDGAPSTP